MPDDATPLVIYLQPALTPAEQADQCAALLAELAAAGVVAPGHEASWLPVLQQAVAEPLPDSASGMALLISGGFAPTYLWITAAQPAGSPTRLGDAVLDTQFPGDPAPAPDATLAEGDVLHRVRSGWVPLGDGESAFVQTSVAAVTRTVPGVGDVDVCVWFNSIEPDAPEELRDAVAGIARSDELIAYLSS